MAQSGLAASGAKMLPPTFPMRPMHEPASLLANRAPIHLFAVERCATSLSATNSASASDSQQLVHRLTIDRNSELLERCDDVVDDRALHAHAKRIAFEPTEVSPVRRARRPK